VGGIQPAFLQTRFWRCRGSLEHPGVMVNTLHDLFEMMKDAKLQDAKFKVTLSYMEIYNELIKDLLQVRSPWIALD
jgi:hypothetical protein